MLDKTLLNWYKKHGRKDLPWRRHMGRAETPYHTWLSEIMLQQTGVTTVIPYYLNFIQQWPTIHDLAMAEDEAVMKAWAGLGYYSRARNLLKCARVVVSEHHGIFPETIDALKKLPGIGNYTANAIRAIAFNQPATVVDGNVERVMARVFGYKDYPSNSVKGKKDLTQLAGKILVESNHSDYAQAIMDLGALICTPQKPECLLCPWQKECLAYKTNQQNSLPIRKPKKTTPVKHGISIIVTNRANQILLKQRPKEGLLGGLWSTIDSEWRDQSWSEQEVSEFVRSSANKIGEITHIFTHFKLKVSTYHLHDTRSFTGQWFDKEALPALSTLHKKILSFILN